MVLKDKVAVIYGAGGGALSRAFAREGAKLFLSGRNLARSSGCGRHRRPRWNRRGRASRCP
jgi:NAD(P)-dependent dehydrogenase (short-subunit alcohol dehydrogenase family)